MKDALSPDPEYTLDDYIADSLKDILYPYKKEICAGNIVVLVDTESQEKLLKILSYQKNSKKFKQKYLNRKNRLKSNCEMLISGGLCFYW